MCAHPEGKTGRAQDRVGPRIGEAQDRWGENLGAPRMWQCFWEDRAGFEPCRGCGSTLDVQLSERWVRDDPG
jgi:hypothetical protein